MLQRVAAAHHCVSARCELWWERDPPPPLCLAVGPLCWVWVTLESRPLESGHWSSCEREHVEGGMLRLLKDFMWCDKLWRCHNNMIPRSKESLTSQEGRVAATLVISVFNTDPAAAMTFFLSSSLIGRASKVDRPLPLQIFPPNSKTWVSRHRVNELRCKGWHYQLDLF